MVGSDKRLALVAHYLAAGDPKSAVSAAQQALSAIPDRTEIFVALGRAQTIAGDNNSAMATYKRLARLLPESPMPWMGLAELQFAANDFFQNNPFLLPRLVTDVADQAASGGARFLIDAYCGSGLLGLRHWHRQRPPFQHVRCIRRKKVPGAISLKIMPPARRPFWPVWQARVAWRPA